MLQWLNKAICIKNKYTNLITQVPLASPPILEIRGGNHKSASPCLIQDFITELL